MVNTGKNHPGNCSNGSFVSATLLDFAIFVLGIRVLFVFDGSKGTLNQKGLEITPVLEQRCLADKKTVMSSLISAMI